MAKETERELEKLKEAEGANVSLVQAEIQEVQAEIKKATSELTACETLFEKVGHHAMIWELRVALAFECGSV